MTPDEFRAKLADVFPGIAFDIEVDPENPEFMDATTGFRASVHTWTIGEARNYEVRAGMVKGISPDLRRALAIFQRNAAEVIRGLAEFQSP